MSTRGKGRRQRKNRNNSNTSASTASAASSSSSSTVVAHRQALADGEEEIDLEINAKSKEFDALLFGRTLQKGFAQLYNNPLLSDITLVLTSRPPSSSSSSSSNSPSPTNDTSPSASNSTSAGKAKEIEKNEEERILAHRMVLCTWSDIFRGMLSHEWKESKLDELEVKLDPSDHEHFKNMLKYMYTGAVDFINKKNIIPLLRLCDYYGVIGLKEVCGELLGVHVSEYNLFFLLDIVDRYDCRSLNEKCGEFLSKHFDTMLRDDRERLMQLRPDTWAVMLQDDELKVRSEESLFEAVLEFAQLYEAEGQKAQVLAQLVPHIRYSLMSPKFLVEKVETNEDLQGIPQFRDILYETYRLKTYPGAPAKFVRNKPRQGTQGFDTKQCSNNMRISDDGQKVTNTGGGWNTVLCVQPFSATHNYIEFKLETGATHMIGVSNGTVNLNGSYAGQYANAWTYYTAAGNIYNASGGTNASGGQVYTVGDKIGLKVDVTAGTMAVYRNGTLMLTQTGIPMGTNTLFPVVSCSAINDCISIVPGETYK